MKRFILLIAVVWLMLYHSSALAVQSAANPAEEAVLEYVEANMPWPQGTARIEFLSEPLDVISGKKATTIRIEPMGNGDLIGDVPLLVRHMEGSRLLRTETARIRIEVLRDYVIAARTLPTGTVLTPDDLRTVQKWVRRISPAEALIAKEAIIGKQLSAQARAGAEITNTMLKSPSLVKKGKVVKVVFDNGPMRIVTSGLSEEDGVAGSIIRVRNFVSNKIIYGRVLGDSLVGVEI